jgi:hypothetical protein
MAVVDERALLAAYNQAVAMGNKKLARELLALWQDKLPDRVIKHFPSRRGRSEGSVVGT